MRFLIRLFPKSREFPTYDDPKKRGVVYFSPKSLLRSPKYIILHWRDKMRKVITTVGSKKYTKKFTGKRKIKTSRAFTFRKNSDGYMAKITRKCVQTTEWLEDNHKGKKGKKQVVQLKDYSPSGDQYTEYTSKRIWPTEEQALADAEHWMKNNPA
tara:strand:- start:418 stop:882 length:465 start_codon:yes stop_codon:yes gene_type:complete